VRQILATVALVLLIRLPFLNQPIQGDDVYYLAGAQHAQIDPAHPSHARYVFLGDEVDMRGHPHPPLNAWVLGAILAAIQDVREVPFHGAYIVFSLIAALAMLSLSRRFVPDRPLWAVALFLATPAFVVNGNSLESDLPFLAFWMAGIALFIRSADRQSGRLLLGSILCLALAALAAYQSVVVVPILWLYLWERKRSWKPGWAAALTPLLVLGLWQAFERLSTGALPAQVLAGHFQTYNLQSASAKLKNAAALTGHLGWVVFPALAIAAFGRRWIPAAVAAAAGAFIDPHPLFWTSFGVGALVIVWCIEHWRDFLARWVLIFFAAALVLFFAGSARYLLPLAAPVAMLTVLKAPKKLLAPAFACQLAFSLMLSWLSYQHWDGYRQFVRTLRPELESKRSWINGEWGLRFYAEAEGGLALRRGQAVQPGDLVLSSALAYPIPFTTGGGRLVPYREQEIRPTLPFRLIALGTRSGYSSVDFGLRPFDISWSPVDKVRAEIVVQAQPELEFLPMNAPQASNQIVSGVFELENGQWRWMTDRASFLLKAPAQPKPVRVEFYIPEPAPARLVEVTLDGQRAGELLVDKSGPYQITTPPLKAAGDTATLVITADKTFSVPGDHRRLGVILSAVGFQ